MIIEEIKKNHYRVIKDGTEMIVVTKDGQAPEEVLSELSEPVASYVDMRLSEYPSIQEQLDMIYHDIDSWRDRIAEIKAKYPKTTGD